MLRGLAEGLLHGIAPFYDRSPQDAATFIEFCQKILEQLEIRKDSNNIKIWVSEFEFFIEEDDGRILFSDRRESYPLAISSLDELKDNLIKDILFNIRRYPSWLCSYALDYIMFHANNPALPFEDIAEHVIKNSDEYTETTIQSAVNYIIGNAPKFSSESLAIATKHITENSEEYSEGLIAQAAINFIDNNYGFFHAHENQQQFVACYQHSEEMAILQDYSDQLSTILFADKYGYRMSSGESSSRYKTIYQLWKSSRFRLAVNANKEVAIFILKNREHKAITLWNSKNKLKDEYEGTAHA
jgi:hypothetical protein